MTCAALPGKWQSRRDRPNPYFIPAKKLQGFTKGAEEVRGRDERKVTWPGKVHGPMGCFVFIWLWIVLLLNNGKIDF